MSVVSFCKRPATSSRRKTCLQNHSRNCINRSGNNDDGNGPEIQIKTFESAGGKLTYFLMWPKSSMTKCYRKYIDLKIITWQ